ncbi:hypothetical protein SUDANB51_03344 [Streptomyces sp. enrichment culture]
MGARSTRSGGRCARRLRRRRYAGAARRGRGQHGLRVVHGTRTTGRTRGTRRLRRTRRTRRARRVRRTRRTRRARGLRRLGRSRAHPTGVGEHRGGMVNTARRRPTGDTRRIRGARRLRRTRRARGLRHTRRARRLRRTLRTRRLLRRQRRTLPLRGPDPRGTPMAPRTARTFVTRSDARTARTARSAGPLGAKRRHELRRHVTARRSTRCPGPRRRRRRPRLRTRRPSGTRRTRRTGGTRCTRRRRRGRTRPPATPRRRSRLAGRGVGDVPGVRSERPPGRTRPTRRLRPTGGTSRTGCGTRGSPSSPAGALRIPVRRRSGRSSRSRGRRTPLVALRIPVRLPTRPGRKRAALRRPRRIAVPRAGRPGSGSGRARLVHRRRDRSRRQLTAARHQGRLGISRRRRRRVVADLAQRRREDRRGQRHGTVVPAIGVGVRTGPGRRPGRHDRCGRRSRSPTVGSPRLGPFVAPPGSRPRRTTPRRDGRPLRGSSRITGRDSGTPRRGGTSPGRSTRSPRRDSTGTGITSHRPRSSIRNRPRSSPRSPTPGPTGSHAPSPTGGRPGPPPIRNPQLVGRVLQPLRRSQQERRLVQIHPRGRRRRCRLLHRVRTAVLLLVPADHLTHRQPGPQRRLAAVPRDHQPLRAPVRTRPVRPVLGPHHEPQVELPHPHLTMLVRRHVPVDPLFGALLRLREGHHR